MYDIFRPLRELTSPFVDVAVHDVGRWFEGRPIVTVRTAERLLRDPRHSSMRAGLVLPSRTLPDDVFVLGFASCQRDGHERGYALKRLARHPGPWATAFLLLRLNDPVPAVRSLADGHLVDRFEHGPLPDLVGALAVLDVGLRHLDPVPWDRRLLARSGVREALDLALHEVGDLDNRLAVLLRRARLTPGIDAKVLQGLLADRVPATRQLAASCILRAGVRLDLLLDHPDPRIRMIAQVQLPPEKLLEHVLDPRANNRFLVREALQRAGVVLDYREVALAGLEGPQILGALGLLAETGQAGDLVRLWGALNHASTKVGREARRTAERLRALEP